SRYFLQAADQLSGTGIELMKEGLPATPDVAEWLCSALPQGAKVGINGMLISIDDASALRSRLSKAQLTLVTDFDSIDHLWLDRPALPMGKAFVHDVKYTGETASQRIERTLAEVAAAGAESMFVAGLDEIAWLLNLRSDDVPHNLPAATSFLYLAPCGRSVLFINPAKLTSEVEAHLLESGVAVKGYDDVMGFLASLPAEEMVLLSGNRTPTAIEAILEGHTIIAPSPVQMLKAVKNDTQIQGEREAHIRDGVAMVRSLMEIKRITDAEQPLTEIDAAEIIERHRREQDLFFDLSFDTISGYGPNGAIVHYSPSAESNASIKKGSLLLLD
ncbi:MAG: aminopeptidase P family N-terminal domain-containing protein, partial [Duncaniella sp.]|nr:aminopeptidase P family N-terminal domain-containing protein [Duncaniella sp.]